MIKKERAISLLVLVMLMMSMILDTVSLIPMHLHTHHAADTETSTEETVIQTDSYWFNSDGTLKSEHQHEYAYWYEQNEDGTWHIKSDFYFNADGTTKGSTEAEIIFPGGWLANGTKVETICSSSSHNWEKKTDSSIKYERNTDTHISTCTTCGQVKSEPHRYPNVRIGILESGNSWNRTYYVQVDGAYVDGVYQGGSYINKSTGEKQDGTSNALTLDDLQADGVIVYDFTRVNVDKADYGGYGLFGLQASVYLTEGSSEDINGNNTTGETLADNYYHYQSCLDCNQVRKIGHTAENSGLYDEQATSAWSSIAGIIGAGTSAAGDFCMGCLHGEAKYTGFWGYGGNATEEEVKEQEEINKIIDSYGKTDQAECTDHLWKLKTYDSETHIEECYKCLLTREGSHNWISQTTDSEGNTTSTCSLGCIAYLEGEHFEITLCSGAHDTKEVTAKAATCTEDGYSAHTMCNNCDYTLNKDIYPATGHTMETVSAQVPTCTEAGWNEHTACSKCGYTEGKTETPATGHNINSVVTNPTCTEEGYTTHTCLTCGYTYTDTTVDATGHSYALTETPPTCTDIGHKVYTCTTCGDTYTEEIEADGHIYNSGEITKKPTCTTAGVKTFTCTVCGHTYTEEIEATGHTEVTDAAVAPTCTATGLTEGSHCSVCGEVIVAQTEVTATGHSYSSVVTAPTCTEEGYTTHTCSNCGDSYTDSEVAATEEHAYGNVAYIWSDDYTSCTATGTCSVCGKQTAIDATKIDVRNPIISDCTTYGSTEYTAIFNQDWAGTDVVTVTNPLDNHVQGESVTENTIAATCLKDGSYDIVYYCEKCGHEMNRATVSVPATGHTAVVDAAVAPTCTATGLTEGSHCSVCDEILVAQETVDAAGHSYSSVVTAPTCTAKGYTTYTCTVCGDTYTSDETPAAGHTAVTDAAVDASCTNAGKTEGSHCSVCGEILVAQETIPATGHTAVTDAAVAPTCTATGLTEGSRCSVCGRVLTPQTTVAAKGHTPGEATTENDTPETCTTDGSYDTVVYCTVTGCGAEISRTTTKVDKTGHSFANGTEFTFTWNSTYTECTATGVCQTCGGSASVTVADTNISSKTNDATCSGAGSIIYTATFSGLKDKDGNTVTTSVPVATAAAGHTYDAGVVTNPTCTEQGYTTVTCTSCSATRNDAFTDALGHTWNSGEVTTSAGCTTTGVKTYTCTRTGCGETKTETIPATGHTAVTDAAVAATCTETGLTEGKHCSVCSTVIVAQQTVAALGHTWNSGEITKDATCTTTGVKTYTCTECDTGTKTETIPATGHKVVTDKAVDPTCTETGLTEGAHCEVCNAVLAAQKTVAATGHSYDSAVTAPTCTEAGYTTYTCSVCNDTYESNYVSATGHKYDNTCDTDCNTCGEERTITHSYNAGVITTAATCTTAGVKTYTCSVCGDTKTEEIKALGHTEVEVPSKAATCTETGLTDGKKCSVCGEVLVAQQTVAATGHNWDEGEVTTDPTCTVAGVKTYTCQNDNSHTYTEEVAATGHTYTSVVTAPTCTTDGYTTHTCSKCGDSYTDSTVTKLGHTYGTVSYTWTGVESCKATRTCTVCKTHSETATGAITSEQSKAPTCTERGDTKYTATFDVDWAATQTKTLTDISSTGHDWNAATYSWNDDNTVCTATRTCKNNAAHIDTETATASSVTVDATCTAEGKTTYTAEFEGSWAEMQTKVVKIDALDHSYNSVVTDPTCTDEGYTTHTCSRCKDSYVDTYVDAKGHSYVGVVTTDPTCTEKGVKTYTCQNDNSHTYTEEVAIDSNNHVHTTAHEQTDATCTTVGYTAGTFCDDCKTWISGHAEIPAIGHKNKEHHAKVESTCVKEGTIEYWSCLDCNKNFSDEACTTEATDLTITIDSTNHATTLTHTEAKAATCSATGNVEYWSCSSCGCNYSDEAGTNKLDSVVVEINANAHNYGEWTNDGNGTSHSRVCSYDNSHKETENCSGGTATCTDEAICDVCKTAYGTVNAENHASEETSYINKDGENHTKIHSCCNAVIETVEHTFANWTPAENKQHTRSCVCGKTETVACSDVETDNDHNCDICGAENVTDHSYSDNWTYDEINHWHECNCGAKKDEAAHADDETDEDHKCDTCEKENITNHEYTGVVTAPTCTTDGYTTYTCKCGDYYIADTVNALNHTYTEWVITDQPTCTDDGRKERNCSVCGADPQSEVITKLGHQEVTVPAVAPTCTETGLTEGKRCTVCKVNTVQQEQVPATGHTDIKTTEENRVEATCTKDGSYQTVKTCTICKAELSRITSTISATGHSWEDTTYDWSDDGESCTATRTCKNDASHTETATAAITSAVKTPATCTEQGTTTYTATFDVTWATAQTKDVQDIAVIPHTYNQETVDAKYLKSAATCTNAAVYYKSCNCGEASITETFENGEVDNANHTDEVVNGGTADVHTKYNCCGATVSTTHSYDEGVVTTTPTCKIKGVKTFTCNCGYTYTEEVAINSNNHVNTTDYVQTDATCTTVGYTAGTYCEDCDKWISGHDEIPMVSHADGNNDHNCDVCGETLSECTDNNNDHNCDICKVELTKCSDKADDSDHSCDICGKVNITNHTYSAWAPTGENKHIRTCTECSATETGDCSDVTNDDDHLCDTCDREGVTACSDVETDSDHNCDECSAENVTSHSYSESWSYDADTHWHECNCGSKADEAAHNHSTTDSNDTHHWTVCECGHTTTAEAHSYTAKVTTEATCIEAGVRTYTCSCEKSYTEAINPLGHIDEVDDNLCDRCKASLCGTDDHKWNEGVITTAPTCTEAGVKTYTCLACGDTKTKNVDALNHAYGIATYTWSADGKSCTATRTCGRCDNKETATADITSEVTTEPTCTKQGTTTYTATFEATWATTQTTDVVDLPAAGHKWNEAWTNDETSHWHKCDNCDATNSKAAHTDAENDGNHVCDTCGRADVSSHTYDNACDADCNDCSAVRTPSAHVYDNACDANCNVCGATRVPADHVYDNACDTACNECGATREITHNYSESWSKDGINHWHKCTVCGAKSGEAAHSYKTEIITPTCETKGYTIYTCSVCEHKYTGDETSATGHNYSVSYNWNGYGECTATRVCANNAAHINVCTASISSEVTKAATCTETGIRTYTATFSETWASTQTETEVIEKLSHAYDHACDTTCNSCGETRVTAHTYGAWVSNGDKTHTRICTVVGCGNAETAACYDATDDKDHICDDCSAAGITEHEYKSEVTKTPTCTETGVRTYTCNCGHSYTETIAMETHAYENQVAEEKYLATAATCTESAVYYKSCDCGAKGEEKFTYGDALGHEFTSYVSDGNATCIADGTKTAECDRCDVTDTVADTGSALNHSDIDSNNICDRENCKAVLCGSNGHKYSTVVTNATCTEDGYTTYTCSACGDTYKDDIVTKLGHAPGMAATCTTAQTCIRCDTELTAALGHNKSSHEAKAPTCTEKGWAAYETCSRCDYTTYAEKSALDHDYSDEWTTDIEPTCTTTGSKSHHCSRCDSKSDVTEVPALNHDLGAWTETKAPTCTEKGEDRRDCSRCDYYETKEVAAKNHAYGVVTYSWSDDGKTCTAKRVCTNDESHVETANATIASKVTTESTCTVKGTTTYTATFSVDWAETQTTTRNDVAMKKHSYSSDWKHDETNHWHECSCGAKSGVDAHSDVTTDNNHSCDTCIRENVTSHSYNSVVTAPTCTEDGYTTYTCNCGDTYTANSVDKLGHKDEGNDHICDNDCGVYQGEHTDSSTDKDHVCDYGCGAVLENCSDAEGDSDHKCDICDKADVTTHTYGDATCDAPATCTECGATTGAELGHYLGEWTEAEAPTCTEKGEDRRDCSRCDYYETKEVDALGHNKVSHEAKAPTCTEIGWDAYVTCSRCDYTTYVEKAVLGHDYKAVVTDPTCTDKGYTTHTCSRCSDSYVDTYVDAKGHTEETIPAVDATCTETGLTAGTKCSVCGETLVAQQIVAATGHNYTSWVMEPTCELDGYTVHTCSKCYHEYNDTFVSATGHSYGEIAYAWNSDNTVCTATRTCTACETHSETAKAIIASATVDATCTEKGATTYTATFAEEWAEMQTKVVEIDALNHVYGEAVKENEVASTCEASGSYDSVVYCKRCKTELSREKITVSKLEHTRGEVTVENKANATCIADGSYDNVVRCTECNTVLSSQTVTVKAKGHTAGEAVVEDNVLPTCTADGSYNKVVYCVVCKTKLSSDTVVVDMLGHKDENKDHDCDNGCSEYQGAHTDSDDHDHLCDYGCGNQADDGCYDGDDKDHNCDECDAIIEGHTGGNAVVENKVNATCTADGRYESVVYCVECGAEISRDVEVLQHTGHKKGEAVKENITDATCTEEGSYDSVIYCTVCYTELERNVVTVPMVAHTEGEAAIENYEAPTCVDDGRYDSVVYCVVCKTKLSSEEITVNSLGHTEGSARVENYKAATCTVEGTYDSVVYCVVCRAELSRVKVEIPLLNHTPGDAVVENNIDPTCITEGSYDFVIYCTECNAELVRDRYTVSRIGHFWGNPVMENEISADCEKAGSYDNVVYCRACGDEVSRETVILDAHGHSAGQTVVENIVDPTCTHDGSYDNVIYCTVCDDELSRKTMVVDSHGHKKGVAVKENEIAPDCTHGGHYSSVVYCETCNEELSRKTITVEALGHDAGRKVVENRISPDCENTGSYENVVYCKDCGEELSREKVVLNPLGHDYNRGECGDCGEEDPDYVEPQPPVEDEDSDKNDWNDFFSRLIEMIVDFLNQFLNAIVSLYRSIADFLVTALNTVFKAILGFFKYLSALFKSIFTA